ncbi:tetratricopeptide repeat protein [Patescibacteria group bacterium]|nr:tetratricopeptide repeat protein [Patescibacteria group bacterium]
MSQKKLKRLRREVLVSKQETTEKLLPKFWEIVKKNWKFLLILLVATVAIYSNGLNGDFVSDDYASITQEPKIGDFWYMFTKNGSVLNSLYMSTFFINKLFGFTSPIPFHLFSLSIYLLFLVVAFVLVVLVTKSEKVAMFTLFLFALHPIHVEAVSWISGGIYIILAIYICLSLINFIYYINSGKNKYLLYSGLFFLLGFLTDKPRPFAAFLLMGLYLIFLGWNRVKDKLPKLLGIVSVVFFVALIIAWPYINTRIGIVNSGYNATDGIFYNPLFQYPTAVTKYLQLLWYPVDLTLYHTMYILPSWLNWLVLINYLALVIYFFFRDKRYFWSLSFIFVAIAPSISPIKVSWLVAERYMFLGSLGFSWFLGLLLADHSKKLKIIVPVLFASLLLYFGVRVYMRNIDWRTNHNLWVNTCQVSPNSHNAWNNIGDDYDKLKDYDNSVKGFTQSVLVKPNYADAYHNRANIFYKTGRLDLARESYETALKFSPSLFQTYLSLTQIDLFEKKADLALAHAGKAVELQPSNPQAQYVLGIVKAQVGQLEEAKEIFQLIVAEYPNYQPAVEALKSISALPSGT